MQNVQCKETHDEHSDAESVNRWRHPRSRAWHVESGEAPSPGARPSKRSKSGYRHFDCACDYGNEAEVGVGLQQAIEKGLCHRKELWITSKLWNTYHRRDHVRAALDRTLNDLQLDYLDLYLMHFPIALNFVPFAKRYPPGWFFDPDEPQPHMVEDRVSHRGNLGGDGITGANRLRQEHRRLQLRLLAVARPAFLLEDPSGSAASGVASVPRAGETVAAVPPGAHCLHGVFAAWDRCRMCHSAWPRRPIRCWTTRSFGRSLANMARQAAQVLLRWGVQRRTVVIPKTSNPDHLRENLAIFDFELSPDEMAQLNALDQHRRFNDPGIFCEQAFNTFFPIYE